MRPSELLTIISLFLLTAFSTASSWPEFGHKIEGLLLPRQNSGSCTYKIILQTNPTWLTQETATVVQTTTNSASASASASASQKTIASGSGSVTSSGSSASGTASASGSGSGSGSGSSNSTTTSYTAIDPRLPPGGVQMLTPAATAGMTFVKVGNQVTFAWNYTR